MNKRLKMCDEAHGHGCQNRRQFLVEASRPAGGLVLSLTALGSVQAQRGKSQSTNKNTGRQTDKLVIELDEESALNKVGGWETFETRAGRVIIVRTSATSFSANSAVCSHQGGPIKFDAGTFQLFCSWHDSRFNIQGQVLKGPAEAPLKAYPAQNAIVLDTN